MAERTTATRAALRAADVRRRGADVERREGPVAQPERRHPRPARPPARRRPLPRPARGTVATVPRLREQVVRRGSAGSARRCGARTRSSTSTTTSVGWRCRNLGRSASCSTSSRRSTRIPTTAPARCGCSTSSTGWRAAAGALVWKIHHTVADGIGAGRIAEAYLQPTRDTPAAAGGRPRRHRRRRGRRRPRRARRSTIGRRLRARHVTHTARRQTGIARRAMGELAMWGADPLRARDTAVGVVRNVGQVRGQLVAAVAPRRTTAPARAARRCGGQRSRRRHLEVLSFPLDAALAAAKGLGGSLNDWFVTGVVNGAIAYHDERGVALRSLRTRASSSARVPTGRSAATPSHHRACRCRRVRWIPSSGSRRSAPG